MNGWLGIRPGPRWGSLQRSPRSPSSINGPTSKRDGRQGREGGGEGTIRKGKERGSGTPFLGERKLRPWLNDLNKSTQLRTFFPSAIRLWNTLPEGICQLYLLTVSRPISTVSVSFEHRTSSCFYRLHCTVSIRSYCSLFAARLSRYISAYSLVVRYCSESSRHRYRKMKMTWRAHWSCALASRLSLYFVLIGCSRILWRLVLG